MISRKAPRRYARALLEFAVSRDALEKVEKDFRNVMRVLKAGPRIMRFMANSVIEQVEKMGLIDKLFGDKISPILVHFLKVLIEKKRFPEIALIEEEFRWLHEARCGIREVDVITAAPLPPGHENRLREILKNRLHQEIILKSSVNAKLLGGIIVRFGGREIDGSYRSRLDAIRNLLLAS